MFVFVVFQLLNYVSTRNKRSVGALFVTFHLKVLETTCNKNEKTAHAYRVKPLFIFLFITLLENFPGSQVKGSNNASIVQYVRQPPLTYRVSDIGGAKIQLFWKDKQFFEKKYFLENTNYYLGETDGHLLGLSAQKLEKRGKGMHGRSQRCQIRELNLIGTCNRS